MLPQAWSLTIAEDERNISEAPFAEFGRASEMCKVVVQEFLVSCQANTADFRHCVNWVREHSVLYQKVAHWGDFYHIDDFKELLCLIERFVIIKHASGEASCAVNQLEFVFQSIQPLADWAYRFEPLYQNVFTAESEIEVASGSQFEEYLNKSILPTLGELKAVSGFTQLFRSK